MSNNKTLFLFTDVYPYDLREAYVGHEIWDYYRQFKRIVLIPINVEDDSTMRQIPENCEVLNLHKETHFSFLLLISSLGTICNALIYELIKTKHKALYLKNISKAIKTIYNAIVYAKALQKVITIQHKNEEIIFYSYWFFHWALVCSVAKRKRIIKEYYSRAHLTDLYELNTKINYTNFKLANVKTLYAISEHGKNYYRNNYPEFIDKVKVAYLGTPQVNTITNKIKHDEFLIVSCSSINAAKRVDEIYKVVTQLNFPAKWIHFGWGGGHELKKIQELVKQKPDFIEIELKGIIPNSELLKFYSENQIDVFINLSSKEGLPVSIMEIQSFGIPVIATDVYATKEAVVKGTGMLVEEKATVSEIVGAVNEIKRQIGNNEINREFIVNHWDAHFNSHNNYQQFAEELTQ